MPAASASPATSHLPIRVYYEDTDAGGIVYYANYLKFCERGRTEFLRDRHLSNSAIRAEHDVIFVVRDVQCSYLKPALLDDMLEMRTTCTRMGRTSLVMHQALYRDDILIFEAHITLVCITLAGRPVGLPEAVKAAIPVLPQQ